MIGNNLLNQIVIEKGIIEPAEILNALNIGVQTSLKQGSNEIETSDGMDVAVCAIDTGTRELQFAGAYRPLIVISEGKIEKIDGNKFPIGGKQMGEERNFKSQERVMKKGDTIYLFSDGYADQFGGPKGKKFKYRQLQEKLLGMQHLSMPEQKIKLNSIIEQWMGTLEQVDDILIIGLQV
jgi:serine phosphatase RsbU (regulator of sigma subunit)